MLIYLGIMVFIICASLLSFIWAAGFTFAINRVNREASISLSKNIYLLSLISLVSIAPGIWIVIFDLIFDLRWSSRDAQILLPLSIIMFFLLAWLYGKNIKSPNHTPIGTRKGFHIMLYLLLLSVLLFLPAMIILVMIAGF